MAVTYDIAGEIDNNGIKIHYEYFGKKDRPCVVIFNGVAMETKSWYQYLPIITAKMDVLLWDYRGQGQSTSDDQPYSVEEFADYLKQIIDSLGLKKEMVNLGGFSTGTIIEAEYLRRYSDTVNKATMSGVILTQSKNMEYQTKLGVELLRGNHIHFWIDSLYSSLFSDDFLLKTEPFVPKMKEALFERYKDRTRALARIIECQYEYLKKISSYHQEYLNVKTPIMVMSGDEDRLSPPFYQKKVLKLYPNTSYLEFPGCAHIIFAEKPLELFGAMMDFFLKK